MFTDQVLTILDLASMDIQHIEHEKYKVTLYAVNYAFVMLRRDMGSVVVNQTLWHYDTEGKPVEGRLIVSHHTNFTYGALLEWLATK
jgi:hypothetical protein